LKFLANIRMSNVDKKSYENQQEILLCNYVDVYKNNFITDNLSFMKATASKEEVRKFLLKNQDVIITKDSETADDIAVPALVTKDFDNVVCGYHLSLITTKDNVLLGKYLFRLFSHKIFNKQFSVFANGVTRYGLGAYYIYNAFISLPPLYEQYQITEYIETKLSKIDNVISKTEKEIELMEKYRKALISEVVTGKIKVINYEQNC
jgi:type I restriction enzyme, S subunit